MIQEDPRPEEGFIPETAKEELAQNEQPEAPTYQKEMYVQVTDSDSLAPFLMNAEAAWNVVHKR